MKIRWPDLSGITGRTRPIAGSSITWHARMVSHWRTLFPITKNTMKPTGRTTGTGEKRMRAGTAGWKAVPEKQAVLALRKRQMKNAFLMLLMSQGSPMIYAGDETGNSQGGNNNAWCQITLWAGRTWNQNKSAQEMLEFVKCAIAFRKAPSDPSSGPADPRYGLQVFGFAGAFLSPASGPGFPPWTGTAEASV